MYIVPENSLRLEMNYKQKGNHREYTEVLTLKQAINVRKVPLPVFPGILNSL